MRVVRSFVALAVVLSATSPLVSQIPTRRSTGTTTVASAPRLLVANPHSFNAQDSAVSVEIGEGLRTRIDKVVNGQFRVLTRAEMNEALLQYGYPKDAILGAIPARSLAQSLNARIMVFTTLARDAGGKASITARMAGPNDDAGVVVTQAQAAGQGGQDLGNKLADAFGVAIKAWPDARACVDQSKNAPDKAVAAGKKATTVMPLHGLANFCLGQLAQTKGDSAGAFKYFEAAVQGDPLSLAAWTQIAAITEAAGDTARTIGALQQMLRIAPTNQPLRDLVFRKFLAYGKPELAEQVADEGLALDPGNLDLHDLRANARIFRENYAGALDDLEEIVKADSSRADTLFFVKYLVTASAQPDTARLIRWSSLAMKKFPDNVALVKQAAAAYSQVGAVDSLANALTPLLSVDSTYAVALALQTADTLQKAKDAPRSAPFFEFAIAHGDPKSKEIGGALLLNATLQYLQPPQQDFKAVADGLRRVITLVNPQAKTAAIANHFLGLALVNQIAALDPEAEKQKSCDLARQIETTTTEAETAFAGAGGYPEQEQARQRMVQYLTGLKPRTASMVRVYCK